jgi:hypothetical protein
MHWHHTILSYRKHLFSFSLSLSRGRALPPPLSPPIFSHVKLKRECESPASSSSDVARM